MVRLVSGDLAALADEQAALQRVAALVARDAPPATVFSTVTEEACRLLGGHFTALLRFESQEPPVILAMNGAEAVAHIMRVGMRISSDGDGVVQRVRRTARVARIGRYEHVPGPNAAIAHELGLDSGVGAPIISEGQVWGAITVLGAVELPPDTETRLGMFAQLVAVAISNTQARTDLDTLAREQAALLRVSELVARGVAPEPLFAAVAAEASRLLGDEATTLTRFESDHELSVVATHGGPAPIGTRIAFAAETLPDQVRRADHALRVAVPIALQGRAWGMLTATSAVLPLPVRTEERLEQFAKLVAVALANAQARAELQALAEEQAALRRVAELAAQEAPAEAVLQAVAVEASRLAGVDFTTLLRFEPDGSTEIAALHGAPAGVKVGMRAPAGGDGAVQRVWRSGSAARIDDLAAMSGHWPQVAHGFGFSASVAVPIGLERRLWGALVVVARTEPLPATIEQHLTDFAELASTAIAATQTRRALLASRARVVATADETRRRLQRDLHDGAQQRFVHALITLRVAQDAAAQGRPTAALIDEALQYAERANRELRDLVRGILPAALTVGGLRDGIESLTDDIALPIELRVSAPRLPAPIETTAYFIVAEALTNVVKHAHATQATVEVALAGGELTIEVRDDGVGGADPARGSGMTGLLDRVEAGNGTLTITSPAQRGTTLRATLPLSVAEDV